MATILKVRATVENPRIRNLWITPKICGYKPMGDVKNPSVTPALWQA
ncbi:hypothetical protein [Cutibacterium avidum]|nr:hypothetical protein [Cutibacterium avidum]MBS5745351.1 hypothetical protein [Propionibacterium sp.]MDU3219298.1 hypothetical protein [Cutibacterium avidum]MDU4206475.1 hypothetical protein [Cutibacterium avidum]MDU4635905.1 hypothetical protein [Cutibacterium avidum]MDU4676825.1 hypothetical protein [Cutibacterium avidum]